MASRLDRDAVLCSHGPQPGDVLLRDNVDPATMAERLTKLGYPLETVERLVMAYYRSLCVTGFVEPVMSERSGSSASTRSERSFEFFSRCDEWLEKPGYCYTAMLRPSQRQRIAEQYGTGITLGDLFKLSNADFAWQRMSEIRIEKQDNWNVHVSFGLGENMLLPHLAAFAADFPTMVPLCWRERLSDVVPVDDGWFGISTKFGAIRAADQFIESRMEFTTSLGVPVVDRFKRVYYSAVYNDVRIGDADVSFELQTGVDNMEITIPAGLIVHDGVQLVADTTSVAAKVLCEHSVAWYVFGDEVFNFDVVRNIDKTPYFDLIDAADSTRRVLRTHGYVRAVPHVVISSFVGATEVDANIVLQAHLSRGFRRQEAIAVLNSLGICMKFDVADGEVARRRSISSEMVAVDTNALCVRSCAQHIQSVSNSGVFSISGSDLLSLLSVDSQCICGSAVDQRHFDAVVSQLLGTDALAFATETELAQTLAYWFMPSFPYVRRTDVSYTIPQDVAKVLGIRTNSVVLKSVEIQEAAGIDDEFTGLVIVTDFRVIERAMKEYPNSVVRMLEDCQGLHFQDVIVRTYPFLSRRRQYWNVPKFNVAITRHVSTLRFVGSNHDTELSAFLRREFH